MSDGVEVELWSTDPAAVEATRRTVAMLSPGAILAERDGRYFLPPGFVAWACEHQGYVKKVVRTL